MGDLDGVGRVHRTEANAQTERHPFLERTDRDKRGKDQEARDDEKPHDTIELHEDLEPETRPEGSPPNLSSKTQPRKLDISA